jgi:L-serine dehydratase
MESIMSIYKIGMGPSSSHTMGPRKAAGEFFSAHPDAASFHVILYGSLGATGKGHLTDRAIIEALVPKGVTITWRPEETLSLHPNGMDFQALDGTGNIIATWRAYSIGGGDIRDEENLKGGPATMRALYPVHTMTAILEMAEERGYSLWECVGHYEGKELWEYLALIWKAMKAEIARGLEEGSVLPGHLKLGRKASSYYFRAQNNTEHLKRANLLFAFALACMEENASGGTVVTAPTCGSCGIVPSVLHFLQVIYEFPEKKILHALATAGLIGSIVKRNASISGAEVGCQGEVGVACAMAAGAAAQLFGQSPYQVEYAAEMALEHHLGLTCDPVDGLVQIPCIERNAMAATRALDCASFTLLSDGRHRVSFDKVVHTMLKTGHDLKSIYRETSQGGLAQEMASPQTMSPEVAAHGHGERERARHRMRPQC